MKQAADFLSHAKKLGSLTLVTGLLGFVREFLIAYKFGATYGTDSYYVGLAIPSFLYGVLFGSALNFSVVPRVASLMGSNPDAGRKIFAGFLSVAMLFGAGASLLVFAFAPELVRVFAPGVASSHLAIQFARSLSPLLFLFVAAFSLGSFQCARNRTPYWGLIRFTQNVFVVVSLLLLAKYWGLEVLVVGTIGGAFLSLLVQAYFARSAGFNESWAFPRRGAEGLSIVYSMLPFALAFGIGGEAGPSEANLFLVRYFASRLDPGSITLLALGNKLIGLPVLLVGGAAGLALLPGVSVAVGQGDNKEAAAMLIRALSYSLLAICPVFVLNLDQGGAIAQVFGRGALTTHQVVALGSILRAYSAAAVGLTLVYVLGSSVAALRRPFILIISGIITVSVNALLMTVLSNRDGARGIALAISIGSFLYCSLLSLPLIKTFGGPWVAEMARKLTLIFGGGLAMHLVLRSAVHLNVLSNWWWGSMFIPPLAGLAAYGAWLALCRRGLGLAAVQAAYRQGETARVRAPLRELRLEDKQS